MVGPLLRCCLVDTLGDSRGGTHTDTFSWFPRGHLVDTIGDPLGSAYPDAFGELLRGCLVVYRGLLAWERPRRHVRRPVGIQSSWATRLRALTPTRSLGGELIDAFRLTPPLPPRLYLWRLARKCLRRTLD